MPLLDSMMQKLEAFCQQEDTKQRLRQHLFEPAAAYVIHKICKYAAALAFLLLVQIVLLIAVLRRVAL